MKEYNTIQHNVIGMFVCYRDRSKMGWHGWERFKGDTGRVKRECGVNAQFCSNVVSCRNSINFLFVLFLSLVL